MKKKILVVVLSFGMLLSMVACGNSDGNKSDGVNATESTQDDGKKDNVEVSEKLQEVQSKYSTDVAGSPDEIKNLNITVFGKEFQTGQTFQEYYEIFEQKAQEY